MPTLPQEIIQDVISTWEDAFPDRIDSWYLLGSHANSTAVQDSDVDLFFALREGPETEADSKCAAEIEKTLNQRHSIRIEAWGQSLSQLNTQKGPALIHKVTIKLGSKLLKGTDLRGEIPLPDYASYRAATRAIAQGWSSRFLTQEHTSPKLLVSTVLSIAAARITTRTSEWIPFKSEIAKLYRAKVGDSWSELVEQTYQYVWQSWGYRDPRSEYEGLLARSIRNQALTFAEEFSNDSL